MLRKELDEIIEILKKEYPQAECSLRWKSPLELLICTQLSAQCTDVRVNMVTPALFKRFPDAKSFADADVTEIEEYIKSTGLFRSKAKNIKACCRMIIDNYGGEVPDTLEELVKLPGTGRKTANLVLGEYFGKPAYVVDTHMIRLTHLIGISDGRDAVEIEKDLRRLIPPEDPKSKDALLLSHMLIDHGRKVCIANRPKCEECCLKDKCREGRSR